MMKYFRALLRLKELIKLLQYWQEDFQNHLEAEHPGGDWMTSTYSGYLFELIDDSKETRKLLNYIEGDSNGN